MPKLNDQDRAELVRRLGAGEPLPESWRARLFPGTSRPEPVGKEYRLVYEGKATREEVLAHTPAAPWQLVRRFCTERPHPDGWRNLLVWGDNLLALRGLLADQQGPDKFGTKGKIKLIYIDPPFATRQDFMKDREKAYRDKVLGAQFIEFLRRRHILLRALLADDGSIYVHDTAASLALQSIRPVHPGDELRPCPAPRLDGAALPLSFLRRPHLHSLRQTTLPPSAPDRRGRRAVVPDPHLAWFGRAWCATSAGPPWRRPHHGWSRTRSMSRAALRAARPRPGKARGDPDPGPPRPGTFTVPRQDARNRPSP